MFYNCGNIWHVWEVFIFLHEVSAIYLIVEVFDICGNYSCSHIISLHHIALHGIHGCHRLLAASVSVQHRTLP